jgi:serine/threonine protein kinase
MHKQGLTHRDLKPENILLDFKDLNKFDAKVADFGFSCLYDNSGARKLKDHLGTPAYMAPEILNH